jgi:dTDP-4-dehydrorhamnose reductase
MHILIIGSRGQLGQAVRSVYATQPGNRVTEWHRPERDITQPAIVDHVVQLRPAVVINCAAWTNVDGAEAQPAAAYVTNALGPHYLAEGCRRCGALLVQVSTNEVFAGIPSVFYWEYDQPQPGGVYARSKRAGELAVLQSGARALIVRVAWLFDPGGTNFPSKMIAAADKHGSLRVVSDEIGNPTYAPDAAAALARLIEAERPGIYHLVNAGHTSRFDFAAAVLQASGRGAVPLTAIAHTEWPRPAPPPLHAVLINQAAAALGITLRPWQEAVVEYARVMRRE